MSSSQFSKLKEKQPKVEHLTQHDIAEDIRRMWELSPLYDPLPPFHLLIRPSYASVSTETAGIDPTIPIALAGIPTDLPLEMEEPLITTGLTHEEEELLNHPPKPPTIFDALVETMKECGALPPRVDIPQPPARPPGMSVLEYERVMTEHGILLPRTVPQHPSQKRVEEELMDSVGRTGR
ncbi:hypothetical protein ADUPG1_007015 [Aduncisulcus paluster]|uniref:Uncharacterized protein n=1 Tax=Aduncisulcus paluster TaxID=2918883 RepID=A0ABQ5KN91_9EUKA|nr:hypothetical protein ADUPG1_007015 [Aduncisulcus paluster]|eukprot:gnl/Carplike_NY0171/3173_a4264_351.p1 GENE.gnl/Carplike_NY0171/3173_a4264_351~~gnl/Carplike_NY0171/3173_a4264_351.p1  ORF type:complete len:180 (+),score=45.31 gnl/Carplike_NY0171/3173_a4264_351:2-541(+)